MLLYWMIFLRHLVGSRVKHGIEYRPGCVLRRQEKDEFWNDFPVYGQVDEIIAKEDEKFFVLMNLKLFLFSIISWHIKLRELITEQQYVFIDKPLGDFGWVVRIDLKMSPVRFTPVHGSHRPWIILEKTSCLWRVLEIEKKNFMSLKSPWFFSR